MADISLLSFDELNRLGRADESDGRAIPFNQYFSAMDISRAAVDLRIALANALAYTVYSWLVLWDSYLEMGVPVNTADMQRQLESDLMDVLVRYEPEDSIVVTLAQWLAAILTASTSTASAKGGGYWKSRDRANFIAEDQSNTVINHTEFSQAKARGMTRKQWVGMKDERERLSHWGVNDKIVGIDDLFSVGLARLAYPKDVIIGDGASHPEEIINCRCACKYLA